MRTFKDSRGLTWTLDLNLQVAYQFEQCKQEMADTIATLHPSLKGVVPSLLELDDEKFLQAITTTPVLLKLSWLSVTGPPRGPACSQGSQPGTPRGNVPTDIQSTTSQPLMNDPGDSNPPPPLQPGPAPSQPEAPYISSHEERGASPTARAQQHCRVPEPDEAYYLAGFKGDTIQAVKLIMLEELADFFPQMGTLFLKLRNAQANAMQSLAQVMEEVSPQIDKELQAHLDQHLKELRASIGHGQKSG